VTFPTSVFRAARFAACILALAGLASAQEPSVILKSLDQLEKRVSRVDADLARFRKTGTLADSAAKALTADLKSSPLAETPALAYNAPVSQKSATLTGTPPKGRSWQRIQ